MMTSRVLPLRRKERHGSANRNVLRLIIPSRCIRHGMPNSDCVRQTRLGVLGSFAYGSTSFSILRTLARVGMMGRRVHAAICTRARSSMTMASCATAIRHAVWQRIGWHFTIAMASRRSGTIGSAMARRGALRGSRPRHQPHAYGWHRREYRHWGTVRGPSSSSLTGCIAIGFDDNRDAPRRLLIFRFDYSVFDTLYSPYMGFI